jgi:hypothetical protein
MVVRADNIRVNERELYMLDVPVDDNNTYRISIYGDDGIYVLCFGLSLGANDLEGHYSNVDDLPNWVQERLAVLMLLNEGPPHFPIEGVGRRISRDVFWVFAPETVS